jgi:hypothetical protein
MYLNIKLITRNVNIFNLVIKIFKIKILPSKIHSLNV